MVEYYHLGSYILVAPIYLHAEPTAVKNVYFSLILMTIAFNVSADANDSYLE